MGKIEISSPHFLVWFLGLGLIATSIVLLFQPTPLLAIIPPLLFPFLLVLGRRPEYGYYVIIALIPLNAWRGLTAEYQFLTISKLVGIWILLVLLVKLAHAPEIINRLRTKLWYPLIGFFLVAIISTYYSKYFVVCMNNLRLLATAYIFMALTLLFVREQQFKKTIPLILIASLSVSAFVAVAGKHLQIESLLQSVKNSTISERAIGTANDPNFFAAMVLCSLPLIAHFFFASHSVKVRLFLCGLFLQNCYAILITYSRSVMLVFIITVAMVLMEYIRKIKPLYLGFLILALTILGIFGIKEIPRTALWNRMTTLTSPQTDLSLMRRASYITVAMEAVKASPVLGSGPGCFPLIYQNSIYASAFYSGKSGETGARAAHNTFLEIVAGTGILGLTIFLSTVFLCFKYLYVAQSRCKQWNKFEAAYIRALGYSFISFLVSFLFLSDLYHKYIWLFLGLSALALRLSTQRSEQK